MGFRDYFATNSFPPSTTIQHHSPQEEHVAIVNEDLQTTCWGCGVHLTVSPYAAAFVCSWCGAITNLNVHTSDNKYFWLRRLQDRCFVCVLFIFMLFMICSGIWAVYPVVFSISSFCGVFNCCVAIILSITTISMYFFAAFWPAGAPPIIPWGSYQVVGSGGLQNYSFCFFCSKPKSPRTHHCRSCGICVLDMDHHCPFIGNCVGAANHRSFVLFLISAVTSTIYISIISSYAGTKVWPPLNFRTTLVNDLARNDLVFGNLKEIVFAWARSVLFLSTRGLLLCYLFIASLSVGIGLSVLLWQQLCFIYEGQTYLSHLKSHGSEGGVGDGIRQKDIRNLLLFFDLPLSTFRFLPSFWGLKKKLKK